MTPLVNISEQEAAAKRVKRLFDLAVSDFFHWKICGSRYELPSYISLLYRYRNDTKRI